MSQSVEIILIQGQINFLVVSLSSSIQQGQSSPILLLSTLNCLGLNSSRSKCVLSSGCRVNLRRPCSSVKGRTTMRPVKAWQLPLTSLNTYPVRPMGTCSRPWLVRGALNCISVPLSQFVSPPNGLSVRQSFSRWPYSVPQACCYFNPSTDMAPPARCLDHTQASTWRLLWGLNWCLPTKSNKRLCVYGIVDSFKDILVIIYSINYRI